MSRGYGRGYREHGESPEPLVWERVTWRQGDGRYVFEIDAGGLHAKLMSPHGTSLTLPMTAWQALLDAVMGARKARMRNDRGFPARSGARWYDGEAGELVAAFRAGRSISQLARAHSRSEHAIEAELTRLGLWDRIARRAIVPGGGHAAAQTARQEPQPAPGPAPPAERGDRRPEIEAGVRGEAEAAPQAGPGQGGSPATIPAPQTRPGRR